MEVHVSQFLLLEIQQQKEEDEEDFWKDNNLHERSEELINNLVSAFVDDKTKSLRNWIQVFEEVKSQVDDCLLNIQDNVHLASI
eukprot:10079274-Ditylum_brightwellii.AAC.1